MSAHAIVLTATYEDKEHTLTYVEWSALTKHNINTIRKRVSKRNQQIIDGRTPYTNEEIVGAVTLESNTPAKLVPNTKAEQMINDFHRMRLVP